MTLRPTASASLLVALLSGCSEREPADNLAGRASGQLEASGKGSDVSPPRPAPAQPSPKPIATQRVYPAEEQPAAPPFEGTIGIVEEKRNGEPATLRGLRAARHEGYDRVVFEFDGAIPGYHVEYVDRPVRACGSGDVVPVAGEGWLQVRLSPANAHDEEGKSTVSPAESAPQLPTILELQRTCDFEAITTYVLGVGSPNPYRVLPLKDPSRLVVDVLHDQKRP